MRTTSLVFSKVAIATIILVAAGFFFVPPAYADYCCELDDCSRWHGVFWFECLSDPECFVQCYETGWVCETVNCFGCPPECDDWVYEWLHWERFGCEDPLECCEVWPPTEGFGIGNCIAACNCPQ